MSLSHWKRVTGREDKCAFRKGTGSNKHTLLPSPGWEESNVIQAPPSAGASPEVAQRTPQEDPASVATGGADSEMTTDAHVVY